MTIKQDFLIKILPKIILVVGFILCLTSLVWYGLIIVAFSAGFLFRHHILWAPEAVKSAPEIGYSGYSGCVEPAEVKPVVFPKPDQHVVGVVLDDSTSGRTYIIKSMNDYGLTWYIDQHNRISIRQKMDDNPEDGGTYKNWKAMGFFPHHAMTEVRWSKIVKVTEKTEE